MADQHDAIIIGAGIIGAAVGYELAAKGWKTINIDSLPAAGYGSTSGSCAIIRVYYSTIDGTAMAWEGYHDWKDWAGYLNAPDERGHAHFYECGTLVMRTEHNGYMDKHMGFSNQLNIPYEVLSDQQVREKLPIYNMESFFPARRMEDQGFGESNGEAIRSAVFWPNGGYISDPQLATHNIQRAAEAKGCEFAFNNKVVAILQNQGRAAGVRLEDGREIKAPVVVNVAGPHSAIINEMAGVTGDMKITTKALRQEVVHVPAPEGFDYEALGCVASDSDIAVYSRPESGNHILVGSEDPECDPHDVVNPDDYVRDFTDQWTTQALRYAQRVPSLGIPSQMRGVVDLYDVTEDWIPIYDKSALPGFYMACGSSGNQFKNAPVAGRLMAALIEYCEAGNDHDKDPLQFQLKHIDHKIDVSFCSRLREINPDSSFSVLG